ncbi:hypothetical protein ACIQ7D_13830 [Streptomyces sp. NPDC096310]|uniref:hypothetical protein n=1 Tax=Streptomyces sp. NPDC096310 TaxID=3366082 RepID=UPI00380CDE23
MPRPSRAGRPGAFRPARRTGDGRRSVPGCRRVAQDLRHGLVEERALHRELPRHHLREVPGFPAVHREETGQRDEQGEAQTGEGVPVDIEAAPAGGGHETGVGHGLARVVVDMRAPAEIAEDVRSRLAGQQGVEVLGDGAAVCVVDRVDGEELAAGGAVRVLGVAGVEQIPARDELEGDPPCDAVLHDPVENGLGVAETGRHMDLPALRGQADVEGP